MRVSVALRIICFGEVLCGALVTNAHRTLISQD